MKEVVEVPIQEESDILRARQEGRAFALAMGFGGADVARIATAISELARNIYQYALPGLIRIRKVQVGRRVGVEIVAEDQGPGIPNLEEALRNGYTTSQGLGIGLPGTRRLMDEFHIESAVGKGTRVTVRKWLA